MEVTKTNEEKKKVLDIFDEKVELREPKKQKNQIVIITKSS